MKAFAKLNLNLHILPKKLANGHFEVRFLNSELELHDELDFQEQKRLINIVCEHPKVPLDQSNLIYKASVLLKELINDNSLGAKIILKKNIPVKAGLGGGSADAAATIKGLLDLWQMKLSKEGLRRIVGQLGRDVYYCLEGGVCEVGGDGSEVIPLSIKVPNIWLIIITPSEEKPSTAWMYQHLDISQIGQNLDKINKLKTALINKNKTEMIKYLFNDFEELAISHFPVVSKIKKDLMLFEASGALLAGSGLSVVGFFEGKVERDKAYMRLKGDYRNIICTNIISPHLH